MIRVCGPTPIHGNLPDRFANHARPLCRAGSKDWRRDGKHIATHYGLRGVRLRIVLSLKSESLYWLSALRTQFLVVRSFVEDRGVAIRDVGHVDRFVHDRDVLLHGNDLAFDSLRADRLIRHEHVFVSIDVIITVSPFLNPAMPIEVRFRGQRRPADVLITLPP